MAFGRSRAELFRSVSEQCKVSAALIRPVVYSPRRVERALQSRSEVVPWGEWYSWSIRAESKGPKRGHLCCKLCRLLFTAIVLTYYIVQAGELSRLVNQQNADLHCCNLASSFLVRITMWKLYILWCFLIDGSSAICRSKFVRRSSSNQISPLGLRIFGSCWSNSSLAFLYL